MVHSLFDKNMYILSFSCLIWNWWSLYNLIVGVAILSCIYDFFILTSIKRHFLRKDSKCSVRSARLFSPSITSLRERIKTDSQLIPERFSSERVLFRFSLTLAPRERRLNTKKMPTGGWLPAILSPSLPSEIHPFLDLRSIPFPPPAERHCVVIFQ